VALDDGTLRIELFSDSVLPSYESEITILRWAGIAAGIVGLVLLALPYAVRRDRWSVRLAGLALMSTAVITFLVIVLANRIIDVQIDDRQLRTVVSNITDGFVGWLIAQTAIVLLIGIALCVYGFSLERWWRRLALRPVESATSTG
jgi:drug/metabolite transporter (DMT)-like permease